MVTLSRIFDLHSNYRTSREALEGSMARMASGDRFEKLGHDLAGNLSLSERFRFQIRAGEASTVAVQEAMNYVDQADFYADTVSNILQRMTEVSAVSLDMTIQDTERVALDVEYQQLKDEITQMTRQARFYNKQTVGRDALVTFDEDTNKVRFWQSNGGDEGEIVREFYGNADDGAGKFIGFNSDYDYSMSRDARDLFYLGDDSGGANVYLKRYDIGSDNVTAGSSTYSSSDTIFVDEAGDLYANGNGTLYTADVTSMERTATAIVDIAVGSQFSVYDDEVYYFNTSNEVVKYDLDTATTTTLIADTTAVVSAPPAYAANTFADGVEHAFSATGQYIADEVEPGTIRVMNTETGTGTILNIGAANNVTSLQFNEDGDRLYFLDKVRNEVAYVTVGTDRSDKVVLSLQDAVVQGRRDYTFDGLDLGGANYNSIVPFVLSEDTSSMMEYEAIDLRQYTLGIAKTRVSTTEEASTAIGALTVAMNRLAAERAKLGGKGLIFRHTLDSHMSYLADMRSSESLIRDVDIARESSILAKNQVMNTAAISMITQHNSIRENVLMLLNR
jgi:flagellin-like hook-associated protein FlgL